MKLEEIYEDDYPIDEDDAEGFDSDDEDYDEDSEEPSDYDCHMMTDGTCLAAGSEECDWECPLGPLARPDLWD